MRRLPTQICVRAERAWSDDRGDRRRAEIALERVDLAGRGDDRFKSYSLGMKQRIGVASALMGEPEVIVLDEHHGRPFQSSAHRGAGDL